MISMDDILDALIGDVSEYNQQDYQIIKRTDNTWLTDGEYPYFEFLNYFDIKAYDTNNNEYNTVAGLVLNELHHIPAIGEKLKWHEFIFEVIDMDGPKIDKLLITKKQVY
jgi:putative hemolysin